MRELCKKWERIGGGGRDGKSGWESASKIGLAGGVQCASRRFDPLLSPLQNIPLPTGVLYPSISLACLYCGNVVNYRRNYFFALSIQ